VTTTAVVWAVLARVWTGSDLTPFFAYRRIGAGRDGTTEEPGVGAGRCYDA
jgi:hypothetical protein